MSESIAGFQAGFASRHDAAARALHHAFATTPAGFAPTPPGARFGAHESGPKHFSPADRTANPTEGWDPLDPTPAPSQFLDPVAVAYAAGYAEGLAEASEQARKAADRDRFLLANLAEALGAGNRIDRERVARQLRQTVMLLVTKLVGEIGVAPELLAKRIATATDLLADAAESALLRVHPDDVALLAGKLPGTIFAAGDAALPRGSFVLETASTIVEDGPELWLEQLGATIERVVVPGK